MSVIPMRKGAGSGRARGGRVLAMAVVGGLLLAACGGDGGTEPVAAPPADGTESPVSAPGDPDHPCPDRDVEGIMQELAAMPYEERLRVMEERGTEEGAVLVYTGSQIDLNEDLTDAFEARYPGIQKSYIRVSSTDGPLRMQTEAQAGRFFVDVLETNAQAAQLAVDAGLIARHFGAIVPDDLPERFVHETYITRTLNPQVVAWNTDLVSEEDAPTSFDDLLDPKWHGQVVITDSPDGWVAGMIETRGFDGAREYLQALNDNGLLIRDGHSATVELLAAGEFAISVENYAHHIPRAIDRGDAPLAFAAFEPTAANSTGPAVTMCANNPYAGALLAHWYVTPEAQQIIADTGRVAVHPDVEPGWELLRGFLDPNDEMHQRLLVLDPEISTRTIGPALELITEIMGR